jgi:hypothetical protein
VEQAGGLPRPALNEAPGDGLQAVRAVAGTEAA